MDTDLFLEDRDRVCKGDGAFGAGWDHRGVHGASMCPAWLLVVPGGQLGRSAAT